jgi:large subunit ribosomal protein L35
MPKMKTNSSAKKRFTVTGSGKLKCAHAGKRHNLRKRTTKAKLALRHASIVGPADEAKMKGLLCM